MFYFFVAVYRIFFVLAVFFLLHALGSRFWLECHRTMWPAKLLVHLAALIAVFYIKQTTFDWFTIIGRYSSGVFLLLQMVYLIDFASRFVQKWNLTVISLEGDAPLLPLLVRH